MPTESPHERARRSPPRLTVRGLDLEWGTRTYVMGILNATPDSFSGDGTGRDLALAAARAEWIAQAGADIVDIGGESTRPGAEPLAAEDEIARVVPVIETVRRRLGLPIAVDTYKARVAEAALDAGADMVNDVWALRADPDMAEVVARRGVPIILMHNRSDAGRVTATDGVGGHFVGVDYRDLVADISRELEDSIRQAHEAGVTDRQIILDPGLGFGKTPEQNLELLDRLAELRAMGYPVLAGPSRKSFIGLALGLPPAERVEGTAATVAVAIARGADIVRVHDVAEMVRVARMTDAIVRRTPRTAGAD